MRFKGASFYLVLAIGAVLLLLIGIDVVNRLQTQGDLVPPLTAVVVLLCALAYVIVFRRLQDFGVQTPPRRPGQGDRTRSTRAKILMAGAGGLVLALGFFYLVLTRLSDEFHQLLAMAGFVAVMLPVLWIVARRKLGEQRAELSPAVEYGMRRTVYVTLVVASGLGAVTKWLFGETAALLVVGAIVGGGIVVATAFGAASTEEDKDGKP